MSDNEKIGDVAVSATVESVQFKGDVRIVLKTNDAQAHDLANIAGGGSVRIVIPKDSDNIQSGDQHLQGNLLNPDPLGEALNSGDGTYRP